MALVVVDVIYTLFFLLWLFWGWIPKIRTPWKNLQNCQNWIPNCQKWPRGPPHPPLPPLRPPKNPQKCRWSRPKKWPKKSRNPGKFPLRNRNRAKRAIAGFGQMGVLGVMGGVPGLQIPNIGVFLFFSSFFDGFCVFFLVRIFGIHPQNIQILSLTLFARPYNLLGSSIP